MPAAPLAPLAPLADWDPGRRRRRARLGLFLAAAVTMLAGAASRELYGIYVFYATIARSIVDRGDWVHLVANGEPYHHKPPLLFWLGALAMQVLGPTALAATLFPRLIGVATVVLTVLVGTRLVGRSAAWLGGVVLLTSGIFLQSATTFRMEQGLACGVLMALAGVLWRGSDWVRAALVYLGIVLALMTKGPVGLLPVPVVVAYWIAARRPPWRTSPWPWLALAPLLALPLWWYATQGWQHGDQFTVGIDPEARGKAAGRSFAQEVWNAYGRKLLSTWGHWTPCFALGLIVAWRRWRRGSAERGAHLAALAMWAVVVFAGAILKTGMATRYLAPAFPALALIAGLGFDALLRARWGARAAAVQQRVLRLLPPVTAMLAVIVVPVLLLLPPRLTRDWRPRLAELRTAAEARLPAGAPIAVLRLDDSTRWWDLAWCGFYLDRPGHAIDGTAALAGHAGVVLVPVAAWPGVSGAHGLREIARSKTYVLAETPAVRP